MKKLVPYVLVVFAAAVVVAASRWVVFGMDDFTLTPDNYKAFIYGFPFRITDCPPSPVHTPPPQVALRLVGNFLALSCAGVVALFAVRLLIRNRHSA